MARKGGLIELESAPPIRREMVPEQFQALRLDQMAAILLDELQFRFAVHPLDRGWELPPVETGAKNRVSGADPPPGLLEGLCIQRFPEPAHQLLHVDARLRRGKAANKHPVLDG